MDPVFAQVLLSPAVLAVLGLCIGSFLNVVIHRLPQMLERGWKIDSAQMLGLETVHLQLDGHQAVQAAVEKQQVKRKVPPTHLQRIFRADKTKVASQFNQKVF